MGEIVYLRLKKYIKTNQESVLYVKDIAYLSGESNVVKNVGDTFVYQFSMDDKSVSVIDSFLVIDQLTKTFPELEFQLIGPEQTIVKLLKQTKQPSILVVSFIWLLLFIGSSMAIMNFHYDVSMQEVQQKLHHVLTGTYKEYPLWMQIPYSLGLGVGMILFFNHLFKKRFNEEPSPLEVELYKYQQDLDHYVTNYENKLNREHDE